MIFVQTHTTFLLIIIFLRIKFSELFWSQVASKSPKQKTPKIFKKAKFPPNQIKQNYWAQLLRAENLT